ncbi:tryptophan synthase beta subunit-like PLP-dependent enzyme [Aspergillus carlsbadensis]|nr:tryptophan synthase beta subunit-like PLP-dependent enzyme [Aspergillus carlsbadensis]
MSSKLPLPLPEPLASIPRHTLLYPFLFSPIHSLPSLSSHINRSKARSKGQENTRKETHVSLYAKREDHSSPLACAGNKYRKLEYIIPDILSSQPRFGAGVGGELPAIPGPAGSSKGADGSRERGITTLVTEGALQSNHTVQVASVARKLGLESVVLLHKGTGGGLRSSSDPRAFSRTGNVQIVKLLGSDVRILDPPEPDPVSGKAKTQDDIVEEVLDGLRSEGKNPYWIPSGASLHPLGGLGYARGAFEIAVQEQEKRAELLRNFSSDDQGQDTSSGSGSLGSGRFDYIFVACGSGSTLAGLIAGFRLLEKTQLQNQQQQQQSTNTGPRQIVGILTSPTQPKSYHEERILRFARQAGSLMGLDPEKDITMTDVRLDDRFVGPGYGILDPGAKEALKFVAEKEEIILDPVYTAKVMRGIKGWDFGEYEGEQGHVNALFIHTGGQSALGAYADI